MSKQSELQKSHIPQKTFSLKDVEDGSNIGNIAIDAASAARSYGIKSLLYHINGDEYQDEITLESVEWFKDGSGFSFKYLGRPYTMIWNADSFFVALLLAGYEITVN